MNGVQLNYCERAQRVTTHIDSEPEVFPEGSKGADLCALVKQDLTKLFELDVNKSNSMSKRKQGTAARQSAHKALQALLKKIADTADAFALDRPDTKGIFARPQKSASSQTLIADGRAIANTAASFVGLFTEFGLSPTFINDLTSGADKLEHAMQLQTNGVDARVRTNAEIEEVSKHMNELIERLDVLVRNRYHDNPAKLAAWESACHLERHSRARRRGDNNEPPPTQEGT